MARSLDVAQVMTSIKKLEIRIEVRAWVPESWKSVRSLSLYLYVYLSYLCSYTYIYIYFFFTHTHMCICICVHTYVYDII